MIASNFCIYSVKCDISRWFTFCQEQNPTGKHQNFGESGLERIFYQRVRRPAVLLFLLPCAALASLIYFEVQRSAATVLPTQRASDAATDNRPGNFKIIGIDGWTVKSIKDKRITLALGNKEVELNASDQNTLQSSSPLPKPRQAALVTIQPPSAETSDVPYRDPDAPAPVVSTTDPNPPAALDAPYRDPDAPAESP